MHPPTELEETAPSPGAFRDGGLDCGGGGVGGGGGDTAAVAMAVAPVVLVVVDDDYAQKNPLEA